MGETEHERHEKESSQFPHSPILWLSDSLLLLPCESISEVLQLPGQVRNENLSINFRFQNNKERCQSGRLGTTGNRVYLNRYRGFESLPLRR